MARTPSAPDIARQLQRMQEEIRQLRLRETSAAVRFDSITDGDPYTCDGWRSDYGVISEPPEHTGPTFGFYRGPDRVYWHGALFYSGVTSQHADRANPLNDAINLCIANRDAAGAIVAGSGAAIPSAFWPDETLRFNVPVDNQNSISYTFGRWAQLLISWNGLVNFQYSSAAAVLAGPSATASAYNVPRDSLNRIHQGIPYQALLDFSGINYRPRYAG